MTGPCNANIWGFNAMKLVTIRTGEGTRAGRLDGESVTELEDRDVGALLAGGSARLDAARSASGQSRALAGLDLAPLVPNPPKVVCVGQNYLAHILEQGATPPDYPTLFNKFTNALIGPNDDIHLPRVSDNIDWEVELAIVIGTRARHVAEADALSHVGGYTVLNDVSARDYQRRTTQWMQGKAFEHTTPVGPCLVTPDEIDPHNLRLWTEVDGQVMQDSNTSDLVHRPAHLIAYVSEIFTLEPGDIIATGTPSGVGMARKPSVWLREGQVVRCGIDGIGVLSNRCVREPASSAAG